MAMNDLWAAALARGLQDALGHFSTAGATNEERAEARPWVGSPDFVEVCENSGFDPDGVREWFEAVEASGQPVKLGTCTESNEKRKRKRPA